MIIKHNSAKYTDEKKKKRGEKMTLGSKKNDLGKRIHVFELDEEEFNQLIAGKNIVKTVGNFKYEKARFILSFKGKERK